MYYLLERSQIVTYIIDTNSMVLVSFLRSLTKMRFLKFILTKLRIRDRSFRSVIRKTKINGDRMFSNVVGKEKE